jgi:hypothetical protein
MLCGISKIEKRGLSWFRLILRRRLLRRWGLVGVAFVVRRGGTGMIAFVVSDRVDAMIGVDR